MALVLKSRERLRVALPGDAALFLDPMDESLRWGAKAAAARVRERWADAAATYGEYGLPSPAVLDDPTVLAGREMLVETVELCLALNARLSGVEDEAGRPVEADRLSLSRLFCTWPGLLQEVLTTLDRDRIAVIMEGNGLRPGAAGASPDQTPQSPADLATDSPAPAPEHVSATFSSDLASGNRDSAA